MSNISKNCLKITQRPEKYPRLSIYLYFYGLALASSRRELDAPRRASENLDPKTGMLGPTTRPSQGTPALESVRRCLLSKMLQML